MIALYALALLGLGCSDADTGCDTGADCVEIAAFEGETAIDQLQWGCDSGWLWAQVLTVGWSSGGALGVRADDPDGAADEWVEWHDLPVYADDPDGWWAELYGEWYSVYPDYAAVDEATTTWFDCDTHAAGLSLVVSVYEIDGDTADCASFGADAALWSAECPDVWR